MPQVIPVRWCNGGILKCKGESEHQYADTVMIGSAVYPLRSHYVSVLAKSIGGIPSIDNKRGIFYDKIVIIA